MSATTDQMLDLVTDDFVTTLIEHADAVFSRESAEFLVRRGYSRTGIIDVLVHDLGLPLQAAEILADEANPAITR